MSKEWTPSNIFEVLASDHAREILAAASVRPVSAQELKTICETSLPTIYRRVNALLQYDLLSDQLEVESDGTHYSRYTSDLKEINIRIENGELNVDIEIQKDSVDQFNEMISDLENGQFSSEPTLDDEDDDDTVGSGSGTGS
jgi:Fe2+ or Zn2+ uptake regulation protein